MDPDATEPVPAAHNRAAWDPWSAGGQSRRYSLAVSVLIHIGLLVVFATVSMTALRTVEHIRVKILTPSEQPLEMEFEGAPSLEDLAGLLDVPPPVARPARPRGPVVRQVRAPRIPPIGGVGPKLG